MKKGILPVILCFVLLFFGVTPLSAHPDKYHRVEVKISPEKFKQVMDAGLDIDHYSYHNGLLVAEVSDHDIVILKQHKVKIKYVVKDLEKNMHLLQQKMDKINKVLNKTTAVTVPTPLNFGNGGTYGPSGGTRHFTYQEMQTQLDLMRSLYPNLVSVKSSIGSTYQNRDLFMVRLSDNPDVDENEPEVFLNAVHHAREPVSMTQLIYFMWHVLENYDTDKEIQTLLNSTELYIVPCVNPDGYVYNQTNSSTGGGMWRKNRRPNGGTSYGVDNNRNYSYGWGGSGSSGSSTSDTYRGPSAFSELENQAIKNFCMSRNFVTAFNYHAYGNYCIYPYSNVSVNNNPEIPLFTTLSQFLTVDNSFVYGNAQATVNYLASGGAEDWAYGDQTSKPKVYGFTPEIGSSSDGFYPSASRIIPLCNSMIVMNKNLLKVSTKYAEVTTNQAASITTLNGNIPFAIKFFSLLSANYTVSINPISSDILQVDLPQTFSSSSTTIMQTQSSSFNFTLSSAIQNNTTLLFEVLTDNGMHVRKDTISMIYYCPSPSGLNSSAIGLYDANIGWNQVTGMNDYVLNVKPTSSTNWGNDIQVNGINYSLNGLSPSTSYDVRVRSNTCNAYSNVISFSTLDLCGTPFPNASNITSTGFTLTWNVVPSSTSYSINYRVQGTTSWSNIVSSGNSYSISGLSPNTTYEYEVNATCLSGTGPYSTIATVATSSTAPTVVYCNAQGNDNNYFWIDYFKLNTITRTSGKEVNGYINTNMSTDLIPGNSYTITYSAAYSGSKYSLYYKMFIDFNGDGDFNDTGETIMSSRKRGSVNYTATFTVPLGASPSATRLRVVMSYYNITSPCGVYSFGEVEDYDINIIGTFPIFKPESTTLASKELAVEVFPNPFTDVVNLKLINNLDLSDYTHLYLYDIQGKLIWNEDVDVMNHEIDTKGLSSGIYFLEVRNGIYKKIIKLVK